MVLLYSAYDEAAMTFENTGPVIVAFVQPEIILVTGHVVMIGFVPSITGVMSVALLFEITGSSVAEVTVTRLVNAEQLLRLVVALIVKVATDLKGKLLIVQVEDPFQTPRFEAKLTNFNPEGNDSLTTMLDAVEGPKLVTESV